MRAESAEWCSVAERMSVNHYFDYNATAPMRPEVAAVVAEAMALPLNPSSIHSFGQKARGILERVRTTIAETISAFPKEIMFTASATEANNWALGAFPGKRVLVGADSHPSVLKQAHHWTIPVHASGLIDIPALMSMLEEGDLVSILHANNETGVIQPVAEVAKLTRECGALLHVDAVQALGKIPLDFTKLGVDMMTIAGHKCGGPVGAAALVVRQGLDIPAMLRGGAQEQGRRAGTENVAAIAGFAKAVEMIDLAQMENLRGWMNVLEQLPGLTVFGADALRLPNTSCIAIEGVKQEVALMKLDLAGFAVSAGSACSSGKVTVSHVLTAMGVDPKLSACAIRVSSGWGTTAAEVKALAEALLKLPSP